ncbi:MAG: CoA transferase [Dehalococcoidales bacterium]|nr:CoA transferase [Dehalococcoidales bacterium]
MAGPLDGVKVVELTQFQQGPVAGMRLGDLGADVIKIEAQQGDAARGMMRIIGADTGLQGRNFYFESCNRNKRSIVIDLATEKGKEIFFKLIKETDVFLTNLSISAPKKLGITWEECSKVNPRLIYAHASGWGREGPDADELSFDYTGLARSGTMMMCGERDGPPGTLIPGMGDEHSGLICAWAVTAALYAREKTGKGQLVDTSLMGSLIALNGVNFGAPGVLGQEFPRLVRAESGNPIYNHYQCKDEKWIVIAHLQPDKYWPKVCKAMALEELENDPKFSTIEARHDNGKELVAILDERFATKTRNEWMGVFKEAGLIYTPVQSPSEVFKDPQALANNYIIDVDHPVWGKIKMLGFPWEFHETPAAIQREAPELGQHTEEILLELGYDWDDIITFKDSEVIN